MQAILKYTLQSLDGGWAKELTSCAFRLCWTWKCLTLYFCGIYRIMHMNSCTLYSLALKTNQPSLFYSFWLTSFLAYFQKFPLGVQHDMLQWDRTIRCEPRHQSYSNICICSMGCKMLKQIFFHLIAPAYSVQPRAMLCSCFASRDFPMIIQVPRTYWKMNWLKLSYGISNKGLVSYHECYIRFFTHHYFKQ